MLSRKARARQQERRQKAHELVRQLWQRFSCIMSFKEGGWHENLKMGW